MNRIFKTATLFLVGCVSMSKDPSVTSYLNWQPAIKAEEVYQQTVAFSYLSADEKGRLFWVESRPEEAGRSVLVMRDLDGQIKDVTPKNFSTRTRVIEYGGFAYTVAKDSVYFVNMKDQRIYRMNLLRLDQDPIPVTTEKNVDGSLGKYMDLVVSPDGKWLAFAYEKEVPQKEAINEIGILDLQKNEPQEARTLASGADFFKNPQFSPDGKKLSWLQWNHPYMPWDSTLLFEAYFENGTVKNKTLIAGSDSSSVAHACYAGNGELIYAADFAGKAESSPENFYNLYAYRDEKKRPLTKGQIDYQVFRVSGDQLYAMALRQGQPTLMNVDLTKGTERKISVEPLSFSVPVIIGSKLFLSGVMAKAPSRLLEISPDGHHHVIRKSTDQEINPNDVSEPVSVTFPTEDGKQAQGYYYPPVNSRYKAPAGEKPPVRVLVHGGPTGMTVPGFSKSLMFWTSQGYAVFDVNYRGSVGFGRQYRDALLKKWGILEIRDVKDGLAELRKRDLISEDTVVSGGSAGGYTVQRLLTYYPEMFSAGASHFGIGNLVTLQKLTHKFESHYLQQLIGGTLENNLKEYEDRSPINHLSQLKSPMIIFQGSDDKVVPPENSREMAEILKKKGIKYEYYEFPGEDHGFRKKENLVASLQKESEFFKNILAGK